MKFDAIRFCEDFNIPFDTHGKNCQEGWIQVQCVFCNDNSNHLGINLSKGYGNCWHCAWHPLDKIVKELLGVSIYEAKELIELYSSSARTHLNEKTKKATATSLVFPVGTTELKKEHKKYLKSRNFEPKKLIDIYDLKATGHRGAYSFRIIAPITFKDKLVSYQGRDFTGQAQLRYKACKMADEIIHHKHVLYGFDQTKAKGDRCLVVEGITDAWRFGPGAVATFGIEYKKAQMLLLAQSFETIFILYDKGDDAQRNAERLGMELAALGKDVEILTGITEDDPGDMKQENANYLLKELGI